MRHFNGHLHGENQGCKSVKVSEPKHLHGAPLLIGGAVKVSVSVDCESAHPNRESLTAETDVCALDRSAFYKRRTTPKPGLKFVEHRLCTCLPRFCRKHAAAISDLSQILPQTYRRCAEREPSADCMACCARSMSCSRAALHIAPCSLRQGQAARRASRRGRSLPTGDAGNRRKTCPAQNEEFCTTKAKRKQSQPARATLGLGERRDLGFLRATLAPVIQGKSEVLQ